jgi:hypothetical protein
VRWFIALLLLANVVLFFWVQQQSKPAPGSTSLPPPEVGHLRLMNEPGGAPPPDDLAGPAASASGPDASPAAVSEAASVPSSAAGPLTAEAIVPATRAEAPQISAPQPAPARSRPGGAISTPEALPDLAPSSSPAANGQPETAVLPDDSADVAEPAGPEEQAPADTAAALPGCTRIGPFEPKDADAVLARLPPSVELISDTSEEYARPDSYYVLIPALPSRAAGLEKLKELKAAGIDDVWLFRSGELRNAISLGLYSNELGARRHAERIAEKGFVVEVRARTSKGERRWLLVRDGQGGDAAGLLLPEGVESAPVACP